MIVVLKGTGIDVSNGAGSVAAAKPYMVQLRETDFVDEASAIIDGYHDGHRSAPVAIPI